MATNYSALGATPANERGCARDVRVRGAGYRERRCRCDAFRWPASRRPIRCFGLDHDRDTDRACDCNADGHSHADSGTYAVANRSTDSDTSPVTDRDGNRNGNRNEFPDTTTLYGNLDTDCLPNTDRDIVSHSHGGAESDTNCDNHAYRDSDADSLADAHRNGYANRDTDEQHPNRDTDG